MGRKLLVARIGAGSITVALCAALPGCNLAIRLNDDCVGHPSSRGMSVVECSDAAADGDAASDGPHDGTAEVARAATGATADHVSGDGL